MSEERAQTPEAAADPATRMDKKARTIGHDLSNCLGVVGGRAELALLQLGRGNTDAARAGVQVILDQLEKMNALVESLRHLQEPD